MDDKSAMRRTSVLRNGLYNIGAQAVRGMVSLVSIPILIGLLGLREYGVWSLAYAVLMLVTISEAAFSVTATVFLSRDLAGNDSAGAANTLGFLLSGASIVSGILGTFLWTFSPVLVRALVHFSTADRF